MRLFNIYEWRLAPMVWASMHATFGLPQPHSMPHMFGIWQRGISAIFEYLVLHESTATCWSLWRKNSL